MKTIERQHLYETRGVQRIQNAWKIMKAYTLKTG